VLAEIVAESDTRSSVVARRVFRGVDPEATAATDLEMRSCGALYYISVQQVASPQMPIHTHLNEDLAIVLPCNLGPFLSGYSRNTLTVRTRLGIIIEKCHKFIQVERLAHLSQIALSSTHFTNNLLDVNERTRSSCRAINVSRST
jgi:hypothetical protein